MPSSFKLHGKTKTHRYLLRVKRTAFSSKRMDELDALIRSLYENSVLGKSPNDSISV